MADIRPAAESFEPVRRFARRTRVVREVGEPRGTTPRLLRLRRSIREARPPQFCRLSGGRLAAVALWAGMIMVLVPMAPSGLALAIVTAIAAVAVVPIVVVAVVIVIATGGRRRLSGRLRDDRRRRRGCDGPLRR